MCKKYWESQEQYPTARNECSISLFQCRLPWCYITRVLQHQAAKQGSVADNAGSFHCPWTQGNKDMPRTMASWGTLDAFYSSFLIPQMRTLCPAGGNHPSKATQPANDKPEPESMSAVVPVWQEWVRPPAAQEFEAQSLRTSKDKNLPCAPPLTSSLAFFISWAVK